MPQRTHAVVRNIIHDGKLYTKGTAITFRADYPQEKIQHLLDMGFLAGPGAEEVDRQIAYNEIKTGVKATTPEEVAKLWSRFLRMTPAERAYIEQAEARQKETDDAAYLANVDEVHAQTGPDEDRHAEPEVDSPAKKK